MSVDRYTKAVLTVIAACLVWLSLGGPSVMTPVSAQAEGVLLRGWIDDTGNVLAFPKAPPDLDCSREARNQQLNRNCLSSPTKSARLPVNQD